jgi:hypothetical protein
LNRPTGGKSSVSKASFCIGFIFLTFEANNNLLSKATYTHARPSTVDASIAFKIFHGASLFTQLIGSIDPVRIIGLLIDHAIKDRV